MQETYSKKQNMVDLGCGSGILPIILKEIGGFNGGFTCLDSTENAVECSKMNLQLYGVLGDDNLNAREIDIVDLWYPISGSAVAIKN